MIIVSTLFLEWVNLLFKMYLKGPINIQLNSVRDYYCLDYL